MRRNGLLFLCLLLSLTACAGPQVVRTETVKVNVPVLVSLKPEQTAPVQVPYLTKAHPTNDDLAALAEARAAAIEVANKQLSEIQKLQPKGGGVK